MSPQSPHVLPYLPDPCAGGPSSILRPLCERPMPQFELLVEPRFNTLMQQLWLLDVGVTSISTEMKPERHFKFKGLCIKDNATWMGMKLLVIQICQLFQARAMPLAIAAMAIAICIYIYIYMNRHILRLSVWSLLFRTCLYHKYICIYVYMYTCMAPMFFCFYILAPSHRPHPSLSQA